jgi:uncharacterized protein (TIGR00369 family)
MNGDDHQKPHDKSSLSEFEATGVPFSRQALDRPQHDRHAAMIFPPGTRQPHPHPEESRPFSPAYSTLQSLQEFAKSWNAAKSLKHFGVRFEFERVDRVRAVIDPVLPTHRGGLGTDAINGGVLAMLFDLVIGTVAHLTRPDARSATVTLAVSFLRPTRGDRIVSEGRLIRVGANLAFAAADIFDSENRATAHCEGTTIALGNPGALERQAIR